MEGDRGGEAEVAAVTGKHGKWLMGLSLLFAFCEKNKVSLGTQLKTSKRQE